MYLSISAGFVDRQSEDHTHRQDADFAAFTLTLVVFEVLAERGARFALAVAIALASAVSSAPT